MSSQAATPSIAPLQHLSSEELAQVSGGWDGNDFFVTDDGATIFHNPGYGGGFRDSSGFE